MTYAISHEPRFRQTLAFLKKHLHPGVKILDLGTPNPLSAKLTEAGFQVQNTGGQDLDIDYQFINSLDFEVLTAFEIFEHMLAPFNLLRHVKADRMVASIPLKLWFAEAYWDDANDWDKHYHEFEQKQFDFLLRKTGWKILDSEKWTSPDPRKIGIRPLLRWITPRYYIVYCERAKDWASDVS
jgi:hypothetical protein